MLDYFNNLPDLSAKSVPLLLAVSFCIYLVGLGLYRLYLSPLAKIPGPKLAALTQCYEAYFDLYKGGKFEFEIARMHEKYGPVVRISPEQVHVNDLEFHEVLFAGAQKRRNKWPWSISIFGAPLSIFQTSDHDLHRLRRSAQNPAFSRKSVMSLEPVIRESVEVLCFRFREFQASQKPLRIRNAYCALTLDIITEYCFAFKFDSLNHPDFDAAGVSVSDKIARNAYVMKHFPFLFPLTKMMPEWLVLSLIPNMANILKLQAILREKISSIQNSDPEELKNNHSTVAHRIIASDLPPEQKELPVIQDQCQSLIGAGQATTADTLERATYELLANPETLAKLKDELKTAMPNPHQLLPWKDLERLPYLSAVISETLRINPPVPGRLDRIAPDEDLTVQGFTIPAGTPIGMSPYDMHNRNPYFPEPKTFKPERWLVPEAERRKLEKFLMPFSRGTRMCIGVNLAYAELYLCLAAIFRRFDMELYETTLDEIDYHSDYIVPVPYEGSERARVIVRK